MAALVSATLTAAPLLLIVGPTASGKTALALKLAEAFNGEILSCDSVAVYRGLEIGTAKPSLEERARVPHHMIDVAAPDEACTAGDYARLGRQVLLDISRLGRLPIVCGGTGLYFRALVDGLFPAPPRIEGLRDRLRRRDGPYLHRLLARLDAKAAQAIHANDVPKMVRGIEIVLAGKEPITVQWEKGRDALEGYRMLRLGLNPPRQQLYERINARAAAMFERGLIEETAGLVERFGYECRPLHSLGYIQSLEVLHGKLEREEAIRLAQQGHRNYAKRQGTWFRRDAKIQWLHGFGGDADVEDQAMTLVQKHLRT